MHYSHTAVILFAYNRPKHFEATLKSALAELGGRDYRWYVFIDGPKFSSDDKPMLEILSASKRLLHKEDFVCKKQPVNIGLKASIILGVSDVFERHEQAIVLEDDLDVKAGFGDFFAHAFEKYKNEKDIVQISGFSHVSLERDSAYSLPFINSWGWGTWRDRWNEFLSVTLSSDLSLILKDIDHNKFDIEGSYSFSRILKKEIHGNVSSWAILFYLHSYLHGKIAIYPPLTLIDNTGFDGSGTHGSVGLAVRRLHDGICEYDTRLIIKCPPVCDLSLSDSERLSVQSALRSMSRTSRVISLCKSLLLDRFNELYALFK